MVDEKPLVLNAVTVSVCVVNVLLTVPLMVQVVESKVKPGGSVPLCYTRPVQFLILLAPPKPHSAIYPVPVLSMRK